MVIRRRIPTLIAVLATLVGGWLAVPDAASEDLAGAIRGTVYDVDFDAPLSGVRVTIVELNLSKLTQEGSYVFEQLPPDTYTLTFAKDGYVKQVVPRVVVVAGKLTDLRTELHAEVVELEEMVVSAPDLGGQTEVAILDKRVDSANMMDGISADLMNKAARSNVGDALKLVVGASVADGKYATVRGLSDRYTGTTLNRVRVPSADPRKRAVQVDLFPAGTVESVEVTKTFTPDLHGDFTGGGVNIETRSIPDKLILSMSAGVEYNTQATGNDEFLSYKGGGTDPFGIDDGGRGLKRSARSLPSFPQFSANPSPQNIARSQLYDSYTRSFDSTMGVSQEAPPPNYSWNVVGGDRFPLGDDLVVGFLGAFTYKQEYKFYKGKNNEGRVATAGDPIALNPRKDIKGTDEVLWGTLATVGMEAGDEHSVDFTMVWNQSAEDEARLQIANVAPPSITQNQSLRYTERSLASLQWHGEHELPGPGDAGVPHFSSLELDWLLACNFTEQDEPDVRFFRNTFNEDTLTATIPANSTDSQNTRRIFRNIQEDNLQGGFDLSFPFKQWTDTEGRIKLGPFFETSDRDYKQRSFYYRFPTQFASGPAVNENSKKSRFVAKKRKDLWTDVFLDADRIGLAQNNPPAPNQLLWTIVPSGDDVDYNGEQTIDAFYGMIELPLTSKIKLIGGARYEFTEISITPTTASGTLEVIDISPAGNRFLVTVPQGEAATSIEEPYLLPSLGISIEVMKNMFVRASWSQTIARPTFRELAPVATEEFLDGDEFIGNAGLNISQIDNYDLRWEWFRRPGEVLAVSFFYKEIQDPIELISFQTGGRDFIQPVNYETGEVIGGEFEGRTSLDIISKSLRDLSVGVNFTYLKSEVDVPPSEQASLALFGLDEETRPLQGQPEYIVNAFLTYDNPRTGTGAGIFYNRTGETLVTGAAVGDDGTPNVFEMPYDTVDFTLSQKITRNFSLNFKAKNLLNPKRRQEYRTPQDQSATKSSRRDGITFALGGSVKW